MTTGRDEAIEQARAAGARYVDLAKEHGISASRVQQIVQKIRRKRLEAECREGLHDEMQVADTMGYLHGLTVGQVRSLSDAELRWRYGSNNLAPLRRRFGRA